MSNSLSQADVRKLPKVLLHDHLDGGLRPQTIIELAEAIGHQLPESDAKSLGRWFAESADSGSLERYLMTFSETTAVMQNPEGLHRVASECAQDLAADGVVYAEVRYAPEQHQTKGLSLEEVVETVQEGFEHGTKLAAQQGQTIRIGVLIDAMRQADRSMELAKLAVRYRDKGVVGFDIAGPEIGFPASKHKATFEYLKKENLPFTIHAGEAVGVESMWDALQFCGANRLGHGVRLIDDIKGDQLSTFAQYVRDFGVALETCPSSNLQTGAADSIATHPAGKLYELGFRITINTDNRLMSSTSVSKEFALMSEAFGWGVGDVHAMTLNAAAASFLHHDERNALIKDVINPGYERA
ncbi:adenosine deaminase [Natronoglycomyces albus]|uniref:adenosine deaminase n=1 Tax=Natronoglycomyces albus TaxID=2811108 RepID=A0A895XR48_9ACTN|nr:adenosine deaminase [Natronoglycomyces albus]QSB05839.1 adenosine deaminase [Natronoglycomyces albus]